MTSVQGDPPFDLTPIHTGPKFEDEQHRSTSHPLHCRLRWILELKSMTMGFPRQVNIAAELHTPRHTCWVVGINVSVVRECRISEAVTVIRQRG